MVQQLQVQCGVCKGRGNTWEDKDKCKKCMGERTTKEAKTLEVDVQKGMQNNQKITFRGEADQSPDHEPGDVVVVLQQKEHGIFRREGHHLFMKKRLTLLEALAGFNFRVPHLDNRTLIIKSDEGTIVRPGDVKCVREEGMPEWKSSHIRGNLYVEFEVEFPASKSMANPARAALSKLLTDGDSTTTPSASAATSSTTSSTSSSSSGPTTTQWSRGPLNGTVNGSSTACVSSWLPPTASAKAADAAAKLKAQAAKAEKAAADKEKDGVPAEKETKELAEEDVELVDVDMDAERTLWKQQREQYQAEPTEEDDERSAPHGHGHGGRAQTCHAQ